ncbi:MAG: UDP-N-acetylmuramate dehydrogenase [Chloroflexota bacterium]
MQTLVEIFGSRVQFGVPMREHTTLGIGGPARAMIAVRSEDEIARAISLAQEAGLPHLLIGGGSNLLVADEGTEHLVIKNEYVGIRRRGNAVFVKSGTRLQALVDYTVEKGLTGLHRLTGVPGTVGGAVYGNAGAYGQTISDHLEEVVYFDGRKIRRMQASDCRFGYRWSAFKETHYAILSVKLNLESADPATLAGEYAEVMAKRLAKYPVGLRCPGSFFMNVLAGTLPPEVLQLIPPDKVLYGKIPAGYLLEQVGAKGDARGGIQIAATNANLFMNMGDGTAVDFLQLAGEYARRVKERYGIELHPEVQFINLPSLSTSS